MTLEVVLSQRQNYRLYISNVKRNFPNNLSKYKQKKHKKNKKVWPMGGTKHAKEEIKGHIAINKSVMRLWLATKT